MNAFDAVRTMMWMCLAHLFFLLLQVGNPSNMATDFVWRQFLLFCHRNGLYYGESVDDPYILVWNSSKSILRCRRDQSRKKEDEANDIVVGSLERLLCDVQ